MGIEVSQLISALKGDIVRSNLFRVEFNFPSFLDTLTDQKTTSVLIRSTSLPESNLETIDVHLLGRIIPFASENKFPDAKFTILNDANFTYYKLFNLWQEGINNTLTNTSTVSKLQDYTADARIYILSRNTDKPNILVRKLYSIYPISISPVQLSAEMSNSDSTFDVTFKIVGGIDRVNNDVI